MGWVLRSYFSDSDCGKVNIICELLSAEDHYIYYIYLAAIGSNEVYDCHCALISLFFLSLFSTFTYVRYSH